MTDESLQPVLSHYDLGTCSVQTEPLANSGGWSGSLLWRITAAANHPYCLRRWASEHPTAERLQFIHAVLLHVAPNLPIIACPLRTHSGMSFIRHDGHLWELTNWLSGTADYHTNSTSARLHAAMHTLATFHNLAADFQSRTGPSPAIADRLQQLQTLDCDELLQIERALTTPLHSEVDDCAARLLAALKQRLRRQLPICRITADTHLPLQPAIRDIHHDHVLFKGDHVTGLIDFGAMRIDTPLTDIARLLGSLVADDPIARQSGLGAYAELRPLSELDRCLIDWLDRTGLILSADNWLRWLYIDRRDMGPAAPIVRRIEKITGRLAIK